MELESRDDCACVAMTGKASPSPHIETAELVAIYIHSVDWLRALHNAIVPAVLNLELA